MAKAIADDDLEMMVTLAMIATQAFEKKAAKLLPPLIEANVVGAGKHYAKDATKNKGFRTAAAEFGVAFDVTNPAAEIWALQHSGALIKEISEETLAAIRGVMGQAFKTGIPPLAAARIIRDSIGLTEVQMKAVWAAGARLASADSDSLVRIGKRKYRTPKGGFTTARVEELTARYNKKVLNYRSKSIARTETIAASNEGQHQLWRQAQEKGLLPPQLFMEWIATFGPRTCVICEGLHGTVAPFPNGYFPGGYPRPPAHTLCRCGTGISTAKKATADQPTPPPITRPKRPIPMGKSVCDSSPDWCPPKVKSPIITTTPKGRDVTGAVKGEYVKADIELVDSLVRGNYRQINQILRQGGKFTRPKKGAIHFEHVRDMDMLIRQGKTTKNLVLYRAIPNFVVDKIRVGSIITDHGYLSLTQNRKVLSRIVKDAVGSDSTFVVIRVPKGTPAIEVNQLLGRVKKYRYQQEIVLGRGHKFKVIKKGNELILELRP